jgi:uncharacterized protein YggE
MPEEPRTISVTGEALVKVIPDYVVITLVVETIEKELPKARVANDDRVKRLLAAAHAHGVAETDIATDQIQIAPRYEGSYERVSTRPVAYEVEKTVVLTLRELATFEPLLAACLDTGANQVRGIQFATSELRKHRDAARALAIKAAREKASALAAELGLTIGTPRTVTESGGRCWSFYGSYSGARSPAMSQNVVQAASSGAGEGGETTAPGTVNVSATVAITFDLEVP